MRKSDFKRCRGKASDVQDRERHKNVYCISGNWHKWAKRYLNRSYRRKNKQNIKEII